MSSLQYPNVSKKFGQMFKENGKHTILIGQPGETWSVMAAVLLKYSPRISTAKGEATDARSLNSASNDIDARSLQCIIDC